MMPQFHWAKIYIKEVHVNLIIGIETCLIENSYPIMTDDASAENIISGSHGITPSMEK